MYGRDPYIPDRCVIIQRAVAGRAYSRCAGSITGSVVFSPEFTALLWMHVALKTRFALFLSDYCADIYSIPVGVMNS